MFGALFLKECKQIWHSLVYYLYLLIFVMFMVSQLGENVIVNEPKQGEEFYGTKKATEVQEIMGKTLAELVEDIRAESFATYPVVFYKEINPSQEDVDALIKIVENCTGKTWSQIEKEQKEHYKEYDTNNANETMIAGMTYMVDPVKNLDYDYFVNEMEQVCKIIGPGSSFEQKTFEKAATVPMTYKDALAEYQAVCKKDGVTDAFMRLYCDYAGIVLGLLPIFLGVTRCARDKRAKADEVIYSRVTSSGTIILSRYLANVAMILLPILLLSFALQTSYLYQAHTLSVTPHYFAFLLYPIVWLLPTILIVLAASFLLTELFNGIVAIIIVGFWSMASLIAASDLVGNFGMHLIPRWNVFGNTIEYLAQRNALYQNRAIYGIGACLVILITVRVYRQKRGGGLRFYEKKH